MTTKKSEFIELGSVDCDKARRIYVRSGKAIYVFDPSGKTESHDPMDRVGGPYRINAFVNPGDWEEKFFLFWVADCYFPLCDLVRASSFEEAYEIYCDWACDNRHILIEEPDLADYLDKDCPENGYTCQYTSDGKPIETENIQGNECHLWRIDFTLDDKVNA